MLARVPQAEQVRREEEVGGRVQRRQQEEEERLRDRADEICAELLRRIPLPGFDF
jgi:hypothetical protein